MEKITDWALLWRQLVEVRGGDWPSGGGAPSPAGGPPADPWRDRARQFASHTSEKWARPDPIRDLVASLVDADSTVLDIGAGSGHWAVHLAGRARQVTALEPSPAMRAVLRERLAAAGVANVRVLECAWPEAAVEPHDLVLCSHAMYGSADLPGFVRRMVEVARRTCCLVARVPLADGVMAEAARRVWGQPHDSPNFVVAYNALLEMGICANVAVDPTTWKPWENPTLDDALRELKRRLALEGVEDAGRDAWLRDLLARRLAFEGGRYVWPPGIHSALAWWRVDSD